MRQGIKVYTHTHTYSKDEVCPLGLLIRYESLFWIGLAQ